MILAITGIFFSSCVKDEIFQGPPVISELVLNPQAPQPNQAVMVSVKVTDMNGVESVTLFYKVGAGSFTTVAMAVNGEIYSGQIPGQEADATVEFYIEAENVNGKKAYHPAGAPVTTATFTVGAPLIVMNEVYSRGLSPATPDPDWIEIYNNSDVAVDISGYKVYDNGGQSGAKPKMEVPAGTTLEARGFYVISTDVDGEAGFGISSGGEELWFENANGNVIDNVIAPAMEIGQSYGRNPDGSPNWELLPTLTPGEANSDIPPPPPSVILLNETYSRGTDLNPDWVEIYNDSETEVDISGFKIYDTGGFSGSKPKMEFPAGSVVPAYGFFVIVVDTADESGFGLSSGGDEVWLENAAGAVIDHVVIPAMEVTQSYGRFPDGDENWQLLPSITRGFANSNVANFIFMNELYSRGTAENLDWIEIYNASSEDIDITGYKIYDSGGLSGSKPKMEFPAESVVPANGFLVITVDTEDESGFGLSSGGEEVWLEDATGLLIDYLAFPAMEETQSFGRYPDGTIDWQLLPTITKGFANVNTANFIVMNEIYSRGTAENPDWVEIYNKSTEPLDISGYKIYDSGGLAGTKPKMEFPAESVVPANGFLVIVVDTEAESGFGLSSGGEGVWLEDVAGVVIDYIAFPAMEEGQSFGHFPDGSLAWKLLSTPTPEQANVE